MLYFQVVILSATLMLVYYCEFTDTFSAAQQGFICRDPTLTKPDPGPEQDSRIQPVILYSVVGGLPVVLISGVELVIFLLQYNSHNLYDQEKVVVMGDCCYVNPMMRRTFRFLGIYAFGLFTTDIFVNAGQLVTGKLAPYFLSVCRPNYTALGCQDTAHFVSQSDACTGDPDDIMRARKTFPSKEAALSLYLAVYLAMYVMTCVGSSGGRLAGPLVSLSLVSLAVLTGINRVTEYRNHWSDVIAGQAIGAAIAVFLVVFVVQYFKKRPGVPRSPSDAGTANTDEASPHINHMEETGTKYVVSQLGQFILVLIRRLRERRDMRPRRPHRNTFHTADDTLDSDNSTGDRGEEVKEDWIRNMKIAKNVGVTIGLLLFFVLCGTWLVLNSWIPFLGNTKPAVNPDSVHKEFLDGIVQLNGNSRIWLPLGDIITRQMANIKEVIKEATESVNLKVDLLEARVKVLEGRVFANENGRSNSGSLWADSVPDHALNTQGASVLTDRCSNTYHIQPPVTMFGIPIWYHHEDAYSVIQEQSELVARQCWAFPGHQGTLDVVLGYPVRITHVTLDHLPSDTTSMGGINSAPKLFEVYGMVGRSHEGTLLGTFMYDVDRPPTQTFTVTNQSETLYQIVELRVLSNWGEVDYTCLYRFRVHGERGSI